MRACAFLLVSSLLFAASCSQAAKPVASIAPLITQTYNLSDLVDPQGVTASGLRSMRSKQRQTNEIAQLIADTISPQSWRTVHTSAMKPGTALINQLATSESSITSNEDRLTITTDAEAQKEVKSLLSILREDLPIQVVLDTHVYLVDPDVLKTLSLTNDIELLSDSEVTTLTDSLEKNPHASHLTVPNVTISSGHNVEFYPGRDDGLLDFDLGGDPNDRITTNIGASPKKTSPNRGLALNIVAAVSGDRKYVIFDITSSSGSRTVDTHASKVSIPNGQTIFLQPITREMPDQSNPTLPDHPIMLIFVHPTIKILNTSNTTPPTPRPAS